MNRLARLSARLMGERGFSIGVNDVSPPDAVKSGKMKVVEGGYDKCEGLIREYGKGRLEAQPGFSVEEVGWCI